ncbi:MAG: Rieske (2Fe-2S) domain protein [Frankiales bacterium]|nr:Rieske (2Fe-2S) domain protein [Frankiales bacterium]
MSDDAIHSSGELPAGGVAVDPMSGGEESEFDEHHELTAAERKSGERWVMAMFTLAGLLCVGFVVAYVAVDMDAPNGIYNFWLGITLGGALLAVGVAGVLWQKRLMPHDKVVEERHTYAGTEQEWQELSTTFVANSQESGVPRRKLLLGGLIGASGMLAVPAIVTLRDLGTAPGLPYEEFSTTHWSAGVRLMDKQTLRSITRDTLAPGGIMSVIPHEEDIHIKEGDEGYLKMLADSALILIRLPDPSANKPLKGREKWAPDGFIAYSKICTHVGCPVALYEQQTNKLLCPCHQSTFDVVDGARVVFGPAGRPLPQLEIRFRADGELEAAGDFAEPVGPSYWERT